MFGLMNTKEWENKVETLTSEINSLRAENATLVKQLEDNKNTIESFQNSNNKKMVSSLTKELENLKETHLKEMATLQGQLNRKVVSTLSAIGVNTFINENFVQPKEEKNVNNLLMEFSQITDPIKKSEFWTKNKEQLSKIVLK